MVNQYSFNLDMPQDDYLCHDKLGAHYSKNWTKEKQNAYNKWYYEHNKDKWKAIYDEKKATALKNKRSMADAKLNYESDVWAANAHKMNADAYESVKGNTYERQNLMTDGETYNEHIKNLRRLQSAHEDWAKAEKNTMERLSNPKTAGYTSSSNDRIKKSVNNIQSDRDKLSNKVRYDVETTAAKARSNISSTINKIKNKVLK